MKVTHIEFEFGMTQNLGDYTNTRPSVKLTAELDDDDDPGKVLDDLMGRAILAVRHTVDNELELAGRQVKYHYGPLYRVWHSELRRCVVITAAEDEPPAEENWKYRDHWSGYISGRDFPTNMRWETAYRAAGQARKEDWIFVDCSDGDFSDIPPLPDPGPEPLWHQKDLAYYLRNMRIDETQWEELATPEHVTKTYLQEVYHRTYGRLPFDELLAFIRDNRPFEVVEQEPEDDEDEDYDDWDHED